MNIKTGDFVCCKSDKPVFGTVRAIYPVHSGSQNFLAEVRSGPRTWHLFNVKNLVVIDRTTLRWRA